MAKNSDSSWGNRDRWKEVVREARGTPEWVEWEQELADIFEGVRVPGSGRFEWAKGDVSAEPGEDKGAVKFLGEAKFRKTGRTSVTILFRWLSKLLKEAFDRVPVFAITTTAVKAFVFPRYVLNVSGVDVEVEPIKVAATQATIPIERGRAYEFEADGVRWVCTDIFLWRAIMRGYVDAMCETTGG